MMLWGEYLGSYKVETGRYSQGLAQLAVGQEPLTFWHDPASALHQEHCLSVAQLVHVVYETHFFAGAQEPRPGAKVPHARASLDPITMQLPS